MLKVGYLQFAPEFGEIRRNSSKVSSIIDGSGADLIVLPELFSTGYLFSSVKELAELAEPADDSVALKMIGEVTRGNEMFVVAGFAESSPNGSFYNSAALIGPDGLIGIYRKLHLFDREKELFSPGSKPPPVFSIKGVRVGLMICFDWIFPEVSRILMLKGSQIICHPSNLVLPWCQDAMITRSIENGFFTITANRTGEEEIEGIHLKYSGRSQVTNPVGERLLVASHDKEELNLIDIEPLDANKKKLTDRNTLLEDRRTDVYNVTWLE